MTAQYLDGKKVSAILRQDLQQQIEKLQQQGNRIPALAVILVGHDLASQLYVSNKYKACKEVGIKEVAYHLPVETSETELLQLIDDLNHRPEVDGILVQLPLPTHINKDLVLEQIAPAKDVDGFHPYNLGRLAARKPALRPCTPYGIIHLLKYYQIPLEGQHAVVVGASNIVGRPMSLELLLAGATVTICHRFTKELAYFVKQADIVVSATGHVDLIQADWVKAGACVVDVGISRLDNGHIVGDVASAAKDYAAWLTPVPGGVGPMTVAMLLHNTLQAYNLSNQA